MPVNRASDNGGPFYLFKAENHWTPAQHTGPRFEGPVYCGGRSSGWTTPDPAGPVTDAYLFSKGGTAIARCEPTNPTVNLGVSLAEMASAKTGAVPAVPGLDGIRTLKERSNLARSAGGEYLNHQFGWKPLVSDVQNLMYAVNESEKLLDAYHKGSGKVTRRGYHYPEESSTVQSVGAMLPIPTDYDGGFLQGMETVQTSSDMWFSGAFKYYLPVSDSQRGSFASHASDARKLYGLALTPEVLWNAQPWSWLEDWYANYGDVIHNISAFQNDGLVMKYGYIMHQQMQTVTRTGMTNQGQWASHVRRTKRCYRRPSTPYGFGATAQSLSSGQVAILAALGLSMT